MALSGKRWMAAVLMAFMLFGMFPVMDQAWAEKGLDMSGSVFADQKDNQEKKPGRRIQDWKLEDFWDMDYHWLVLIVWFIFPRVLPVIFCFKLDATIGQWAGYIIGGVFIMPRLTCGLILLWYFPDNQTLAWVAIILGAILDLMEGAFWKSKRG